MTSATHYFLNPSPIGELQREKPLRLGDLELLDRIVDGEILQTLIGIADVYNPSTPA
jgi:hypothetical protein